MSWKHSEPSKRHCFSSAFHERCPRQTNAFHSFVHTLFLCECVTSSVLEQCALFSACLCFMLERGVQIPALMTWVSVSCRGLDTRAPRSVLCECAVSSSLGHVLFCSRVLCCCTQFVFLSAACIHVISRAVWHAACVFIGCMLSMLSCLVWTCCLWVFSLSFSLAVCPCPVLHMAGYFCWPCACVFVWCEHMAFVLVFCVPCALLSIVLTPPILFPDYWLINPTWVLSTYPPHLLPS